MNSNATIEKTKNPRVTPKHSYCMTTRVITFHINRDQNPAADVKVVYQPGQCRAIFYIIESLYYVVRLKIGPADQP